jgi:hypothetical protein
MRGQTLRLSNGRGRGENGRGRGETDIAGHQGPNKIIAFVADLGGLEASYGIQQA